MTEVLTGHVCFEEQLDGSAGQVFTVQERIAAAVTTRLNRERPAPEPSSATTRSLEAYGYYTRGRQLWRRFQKGAQEQARELFERAVHLDPGYARALAGLAIVDALRCTTLAGDPQTLERAAGYARRALAADLGLSEARVWLGYILMNQGKGLEGYREERRAMELDPSNAIAPYFAANLLLFSYRRREALRLYEAVTGQPGTQEPDPHCWRRREAVRLCQRALELNPRYGWAWLGLGVAHLDLGSGAEARWCLEKAVALEPLGLSPAGVAGYLGECLRRGGALAEARAHCLAGLEAVEKTDHSHRDTVRGVCLCSLGRTSLQQGNVEVGRAAFRQAVLHLRGRPRARGGGHLLVQALAGQTQAGEGPGPVEEALRLFEQRGAGDFHFLWGCTDDVTLLELARGARTLGRTQQACILLEQALDAGSAEAIHEVMT
jgi:tetratricopeptide (TPR) repeat protein